MPRFSLLLALALAACSGDVARFAIDPAPVARAYPDRIGTAELREVSLPQYAADQEIAAQSEDGALRSNPKEIWADNPPRAVTLALARQISQLSGATVIAEPWPLSDLPARRIEVRVEQFVPTAQGMVRLSGLYFVTPQGGGGGDLMRRFDLSVPVQGEGAAATVAAQSEALTQLARRIAQLQ
ncbi:PqiC family protein [Paenirhodobacter sp.]|jgi:uncharacterized lipoprotein YmbA|uniref:PqiC family protein n=1 Tax=Paenirhodobacter sp. TaxID=1965326 RepID=UPI003B5070F0